jgi:hypothetical protein
MVSTASSLEACPDHRPLVLAEESLDPFEGRRIHVPGVTGKVGHMFHAEVGRSMEAVVHARLETQGDIQTIPVGFHLLRIPEQVRQG